MKIYQKIQYANGKTKRKYLYGIFKTITICNYKEYYFLGVKFYKRLDIEKELIDIRAYVFNLKSEIFSLQVRDLHMQVFPQFKAINKNKEVAIIATAPSLRNFKSIENAVYIGVNRAFQYDKVKLDYLFMADFRAVKEYIHLARHYKCVKFYGIYNHNIDIEGNSIHIPDFESQQAGALRFYVDNKSSNSYPNNIETNMFFNVGTIVHSAFCFALYTQPKRIYIVGCDLNDGNSYFDGNSQNLKRFSRDAVCGFKKLKEFADICYPNIEIVSINPVGLKGVFYDLFTNDRN
jgi:hypothetical protein